MAWPKKPLKELVRRIGGGTPARDEKSYWGGDLPWFTVADLTDCDDIQSLSTSREGITRRGLESSAAKLVPPGSVVFSSRVVVGKVGIAANQLVTNQDFSSFVPSKAIDSRFLAYFLIKAKYDLRKHQRGATIKGVTTSVLEALEIPVPSISEQEQIVAKIKECMERIEEIERLREGCLNEARAVLPSVLNQVFESIGGQTAPSAIGDVAIETRYGTSQKCHSEKHGLAILRIPNVAKGKVNFEDLKYCDLSSKDVERVRLQDGDLLFVRTNGSRDLVGRCAIFEANGRKDTFGFASYLIRVRLDKRRILPKYLAYFLNSTKGREEINKRRRTSAGQFNINSENLRTIYAPLTSLEEQERILRLVAERESHIVQLIADMARAKEESSFMREAVLRRTFGE